MPDLTAMINSPFRNKNPLSWQVIGTSRRGEAIDIKYYDSHDARDFAAEVNAGGGNAKASRITSY